MSPGYMACSGTGRMGSRYAKSASHPMCMDIMQWFEKGPLQALVEYLSPCLLLLQG
jgi:hypothetical protein